jgi:hypothetical protein
MNWYTTSGCSAIAGLCLDRRMWRLAAVIWNCLALSQRYGQWILVPCPYFWSWVIQWPTMLRASSKCAIDSYFMRHPFEVGLQRKQFQSRLDEIFFPLIKARKVWPFF